LPRIEVFAAVLVGAWLERASVGLPAALERGADMLLVVATAVLVMVGYRRVIRRQLTRTRAGRAQRAATPPAETT
jgi:hypothetical protein